MHMRAYLGVLAASVLASLRLLGDVTIESNAVVATVTPFAETAWMSVSGEHDWTPWYVTDTDGDGVVRLCRSRSRSRSVSTRARGRSV
jgi:hypothetical protein